MTNGEIVLGIALVCLSIALIILSLKVYRYEQHFHSIQKLFFILGTKVHTLEHAVGVEHEEVKKNVSV